MLSFQAMNTENKDAESISAIKKALYTESPSEWVKKAVSYDAGTDSAHIAGQRFDLGGGKLFVSGFGKCAGGMAEGVSEIFGDRIEKGVLISYENKKITDNMTVLASSHPLPGIATVEASQKLVDLHRASEENDTILCLVSGGGSSFFEIPEGGVALGELITVNRLLLSSGAPVAEMNMVRKALSKVKGGKLLEMTKARLITLAISDVIGGGPGDIASGPTWLRTGRPGEAAGILKKYNILQMCPESVLTHLNKDDAAPAEINETAAGEAVADYFIIGDNSRMKKAVSGSFSGLGFEIAEHEKELTGPSETEARDFTERLLKLAASASGPACLVAGGEVTVAVSGKKEGGRCQHFVLLCAGILSGTKIESGREITVMAFASDGVDGFTDCAGAVFNACGAAAIGPEIINGYARDFASHDFFEKYGGLIHTGPTGHNVNDFFIGLIN